MNCIIQNFINNKLTKTMREMGKRILFLKPNDMAGILFNKLLFHLYILFLILQYLFIYLFSCKINFLRDILFYVKGLSRECKNCMQTQRCHFSPLYTQKIYIRSILNILKRTLDNVSHKSMVAKAFLLKSPKIFIRFLWHRSGFVKSKIEK